MRPTIFVMDLEGCLIPEIWLHIADKTGIADLRKTTRDVADYRELMNGRLAVLDQHKIKLSDIQAMLADLGILEGARDFVEWVREKTEFIILSDTYVEFAKPLMKGLGNPTLFCHRLTTNAAGQIDGYALRSEDSKADIVRALKGNGFRIMAAGDSFNDSNMLIQADSARWFRAPASIVEKFPQFPALTEYQDLKNAISQFLL